MKYIALSLSLLLAGCTVTTKADPEVLNALQAHTQVIGGISHYLISLQEAGVLPTVDKVAKKEIGAKKEKK